MGQENVKGVVAGLKALGDGIKQVESGLQDCSHLESDWEKLETMVAVFTGPEAFAFHTGKDLLVNGVDIFHEIGDAVTDYEDGNWSGFGKNVGEAAAKTFIGTEKLHAPKTNKDK